MESQRERLANRAVEFYRKGNQRQALKFFLEAYRLDPLDDLLFNIAKVYDTLDERDLAIEYYEQYTLAEEAQHRLKVRALEQIRRLREEIAAQEAGWGDKEEEKEEEKEKKEEGKKQAASQQEEGRSTTEPAGAGAAKGPEGGSRLRTGGWISLIGAAVLAGSSALLASGMQLSLDEFHASGDPDSKRKHREAAEAQALGADLCFAGAAVAGLAGGLMLLLAPKETETGTQDAVTLRLLPSPAPGAAMTLSLSGQF